MSIVVVKMLSAVALCLMSGTDAGTGYRLSFTGIPYSCRYDLPPVAISNADGTTRVGFENPRIEGGNHWEIRSSTLPFQVKKGDESLTLDIAYSVSSTPPTDAAVRKTMEDSIRAKGNPLVWWRHRIALADAVSGKDLQVLDFRRFEAASPTSSAPIADAKAVTVDLRPFAGRTLQVKYISLGYTLIHHQTLQGKRGGQGVSIAVESFNGARSGMRIR